MSKTYSRVKRTMTTCNYCFYEWLRGKGKRCPRCNNKYNSKPKMYKYNFKINMN